MRLEKWKILSSKKVFSASPWVTVFKDKIQLPSGNIIPDFYTVDLPDYVIVYATNNNGDILFEKQYKHALKEITHCLPAGFIEPGETPMDAAKREFIEETGYLSKHWVKLGEYVIDGNKRCSTAHLFKAFNIEKITAPIPDGTEVSEIVFLTEKEALNKLVNGEFKVIATAAFIAMATNKQLNQIINKS